MSEKDNTPHDADATNPLVNAGYPQGETEKRGSNASTSEWIGPYKLLQQIGEGGMGAVWMAEQERPVRRKVALKLIKGGLGNKQVIARFEAERQVLAMMDHQNIAKVLDANTTSDGLPYFVMELVQGIPFNKYCDQNKLTINERLQLFIPVCNAVQHAHQKGIIHRDLKPTNVLVSLYDGRPVPKVIDFGLAKALQHTTRLTDKTLFTEFGQVVGTLQYMSPEQAEMNQLDIDTRTDIYSLGVMLYELLTGSTPIEADTLRNNAILQVLATIRDQDPPRPSVRFSSNTNEAVAGISTQRNIEPAKLKTILRGDLDWIVMRAVEKDRTRRYETANGFAEDISRYLAGDVVSARPPSTGYRLKKYVRKHKGLVVSVASIVTLLLLAVVGTTLGMTKAYIAKQKLETALTEVKSERDRAGTEADRAQAFAAERDGQRHRAEEEANHARRFSDLILAKLSPIRRNDQAPSSAAPDVPVQWSIDPGELLAELIELELSAPHQDSERVVDLGLRLSNWRRYVEQDGAGAIVAARDALSRASTSGSRDTLLKSQKTLAALLLRSQEAPESVDTMLAEILTALRAESKSSTGDLQSWLMSAAYLAMQNGDSSKAFSLFREMLALTEPPQTTKAGKSPIAVRLRTTPISIRLRTILAALSIERGDMELTNEFAKPVRFLVENANLLGGLSPNPDVSLLRATLAYAETRDRSTNLAKQQLVQAYQELRRFFFRQLPAAGAKQRLVQAYQDLEPMRFADPSSLRMVIEWLCRVSEADGTKAEAEQWRGALRDLDKLANPQAIKRPKNLDFEKGAGRAGLPRGWEGLRVYPRTGGVGATIGVDSEVMRSGSASARMQRSSNAESTTTLTQAVSANSYRSKKARLSGWIRTSKAATGAGLWLRVDGAGGISIEFDNMAHRLVKGDSDWTHCEIAFDVPESATTLAFGAILFGEGTAWIDDMNLSMLDSPTYAGTWESTFGTLNLQRIGRDFKGDYKLGDMICTLKGEAVGDRLVFSYFEPGIDGEGWFELAEDGQSFSGEFRERWKPSWESWNGIRSSGDTKPGRPINLDFEQGPLEQVPVGWIVPPSLRIAGYLAVLSDDAPVQGRSCARISPPVVSGPEFNNLMQVVDAKPHRGKRIRLSAAVRVEGHNKADQAQIWLRVDRAGNMGTGLFDNMRDRPIRSNEWGRYEISGVVDDDAAQIVFGIIVFGEATAWLDDVRFEIMDE